VTASRVAQEVVGGQHRLTVREPAATKALFTIEGFNEFNRLSSDFVTENVEVKPRPRSRC
jgi:hypothetical protein